MSTHTIPLQDRDQVVGGPTASIAVVAITATICAAAALAVSAALHIYAGVSAAPLMAESTISSPLWLSVWNILLPISLMGVTVITYRFWRERELSE